jgi:hypothetical protein
MIEQTLAPLIHVGRRGPGTLLVVKSVVRCMAPNSATTAGLGSRPSTAEIGPISGSAGSSRCSRDSL